MNRATYYNFIEERLITLCTRVELRGKINILDYHLHSENFYRDLFNKLYTWNLENLNSLVQNVEAIDLIDRTKNIIIQVSATNTKAKIDSALSKPSLFSTNYTGFNFKFISIARDANNLRSQSYTPPTGINFIPATDIYDARSILQDIYNLDINTFEIIYKLIKSELGRETDVLRLESNLSSVINILSKENLAPVDLNANINSFEIDRKIDFNNLNTSKEIINDYKYSHHIVDRIYSEFDKSGCNKSISVLNTIKGEYNKHSLESSGDELFNLVISNISERILQSSNFEKIPQEEMEMCVGILVVDAFIRCKIFKNPNDYNYATS
ncbi:ABC-three component system protein [Coprobacter tertius]|uniref:SMEK domain-containing protein n=1 Tax=Coprobacter tertius TaxID=2944915 RepID=A0ABT1MDU3_9BACT|nr:ABC-three component system protein [Coprobacter tertius]MCP9610803.1 SMEK domain-containing protein [Coprobacter tertius]